MSLSPGFLVFFSDLQDPRAPDRNRRHSLDDIFVITILATICGADNWVKITEFAASREDWLGEFLEFRRIVSIDKIKGLLYMEKIQQWNLI